MSEFDALLDQNVQRAEALSLEAQQVFVVVDRLSQLTNSLSSTLNSTTERSQAQFQELVARLTESEQTLESELQTVRATFEELHQKSSQVESQLEATFNEIVNHSGSFKDQTDVALSSLEQEFEQTKTELNQISDQVQEFEATLGGGQETVGGGIEGLQATVDSARDSFDSLKTDLLGQFDTFEEDLAQRLQVLMQNFTALMDEGDNKLSELEAVLDSSSDETMGAIAQKLTQDFADEIGNSAETVDQAISSVQNLGLQKVSDLTEKFQDILGSVDDVMNLLDEMKPVLDMIDQFT